MAKKVVSLNFPGGFRGAVLLACLCDASKKQAKERESLIWKKAGEKIIFLYIEATGV